VKILRKENMKKINDIKCFVLDMDGTIYLGNELFECTKPFLERVRKTGREFFFFTNNSSKSRSAYVEKLSGMGINIEDDQMMISTHVAVKYLQKHYPGMSIYVVGTPSLETEFEMNGMKLVQEDPDIVILGFDTTLTYEKLEKACRYIRHGCIYYGINPDWNCPVEGGEFIPDCGSIAKLIEASTGRAAEFFGKPSKHTLDYIIEKTGFRPEEIAIVGDRLYTDIAVADGSDVCSVLVLSGESSFEDVEKSDVKPDLIFDSLADITSLLQ
jgi:glycerol-1-phosphate dehydrogenase [NAD(P)+]